jgi:hypothetical protein
VAGRQPGTVSYYMLTPDGAFAIGVDPAEIEASDGA